MQGAAQISAVLALGHPVAVVVACTVVNALTVVTCAHKSSLRQAQQHTVLQSGGGVKLRAVFCSCSNDELRNAGL